MPRQHLDETLVYADLDDRVHCLDQFTSLNSKQIRCNQIYGIRYKNREYLARIVCYRDAIYDWIVYWERNQESGGNKRPWQRQWGPEHKSVLVKHKHSISFFNVYEEYMYSKILDKKMKSGFAHTLSEISHTWFFIRVPSPSSSFSPTAADESLHRRQKNVTNIIYHAPVYSRPTRCYTTLLDTTTRIYHVFLICVIGVLCLPTVLY
jgi:hypothetical protein